MANALHTLFINIRASSVDLVSDLNKATNKITKLGRDMERVGAFMTTRFSIPLFMGFQKIATSFLSFDEAMVEAIAKMEDTTKGAEQMGSALRKALEGKAFEVAKITSFGPTEMAKAYKHLAEAGFSAQEMMAALPAVAKYAQAGNIELAESTDLLVNAIAATGMAYKDVYGPSGEIVSARKSSEEMAEAMRRVSDVTLKASLQSTTDLVQLMSAILTRSGAEFRSANLDVEHLTAAVATLANNGVKAEKAGNTLAVVMRDLSAKAAENADRFRELGIEVYNADRSGIRPLGDIIKDFEDKFDGMSLAAKQNALAFVNLQLRTRSAFNVFVGMSPMLQEFEESLYSAGGTTEEVAKKQMEAFRNKLKQVGEQFEIIGYDIGTILIPWLTKLAQQIANYATELNKSLSPAMKEWIVKTLVISALMGPLIFMVGSLLRGVTLLSKALMFLLVPSVLSSWKNFIAWEAAGKPLTALMPNLVKGIVNLGKWLFWAHPIIGMLAIAIGALAYKFFTSNTTIKAEIERAKQLVGIWTNQFKQGIEKIKKLDREDALISRFTTGLRQGFKNWTNDFSGTLNFVTRKFSNYINTTKSQLISIQTHYKELDLDTKKAIFEHSLQYWDFLISKIDEAKKALSDYSVLLSIAFPRATNFFKTWFSDLQYPMELFGDLGHKEEESTTIKKPKPKTSDFDTPPSKLKKQKEALTDLEKKLEDLRKSIAEENLGKWLESSIDTAVKWGQPFSAIEEKLRESIRNSVSSGIDEGLRDTPQGLAYINEETERQLTTLKESFSGKMLTAAQAVGEAQKEAFADSVAFWENAMENAITGVTFNLKDSLKQVAIGAGSQFLAQLTGFGGAGITSLKDLGRALMSNQFISGPLSGSGGSSIFSAAGLGNLLFPNIIEMFKHPDAVGNVLGGEYLPGAAGTAAGYPAASATASLQGMAEGAIYMAAIANALDQFADFGRNTRQTSQAVGTGLGAVAGMAGGPLGAAVGSLIGSVIGDAIGGMLSSNGDPMAEARKSIEEALEQRLIDAGGFTLSSGEAFGTNLIFGSRGRFEEEGFAEKFKEIAGEGFIAFDSLGKALTAFLGVTEDVGGQIGFILAENLNGNLNDARLLFQALGIDAGELEEAMVQAGKAGEKSWHEVEVSLQGLSQVTAAGLVEIANVEGAYQQLINSGGRGMQAIIALKNIAVEAAESGAKDIDDLQQALTDLTDLNEEEINRLVEALKNRNINSLDELLAANDRVLGGIVADLQSMGIEWKEASENIAEGVNEIESLAEAWEQVPSHAETDYVINTRYNVQGGVPDGANLPSDLTGFAKGGIVKGATLFGLGRRKLGLMGERGYEAILPVSRMSNGQMGIAAKLNLGSDNPQSSININIDARGAAPGVENDIRNALLVIKDQAVNEAVYKIREMQRRY